MPDKTEDLAHEENALDPRINALARAFEKMDLARYEWSDELFEIWWTKDSRNKNHAKQRAKAEAAIKLLDEWE
jgi:hypothetical protein